MPGDEATCLEQRADERLEPLGGRVADARFPILDGSAAGTGACRQVALVQSCTRAIAQELAAERFGRI
jgi:hypothetical protein